MITLHGFLCTCRCHFDISIGKHLKCCCVSFCNTDNTASVIPTIQLPQYRQHSFRNTDGTASVIPTAQLPQYRRHSFRNTDGTLTSLTPTLSSYLSTLLLHVCIWYVGCLDCVLAVEFVYC